MRPRLFKNYVSEEDQFLSELDKRYPQKAEEVREELQKLQRIFKLRDKLQYLYGDTVTRGRK